MSNHVPVHLKHNLMMPFEIFHGTRTNPRIWFELFFVKKYHHSKDGSVLSYQHQTHALCGISVVQDPTSNNIKFYNPITRAYYSPGTYSLYDTTVPITLYPKYITYYVSLMPGLFRN